MNIIDEMECQKIYVELKYCERCGGLWLRPHGVNGVYCASCSLRLAARPDPGKAPARKPRRRKARLTGAVDGGEGLRHQTRLECLQGVAMQEMEARP